MKKIILIGFMGSGKTSVSLLLSEKLNLPLYSLDQLIEEKYEIGFREYEIEMAKSLKDISFGIFDCGGGVVMNKIILDYLKEKNGIIVYLKTSFLEIKKRLKNDNQRPLFKDLKKAKKIYCLRRYLYENYADLIVLTDKKTVEEVSDEIISQI
jgi:shikimate kinase